jgi:uncharacterized protein (TIGR03083 family)
MEDFMQTTPDTRLDEHWHHHGIERVAHHVSRLVALVRDLDDEQLAAPVPESDWTVVETFAHVVTVWQRYTVNRERAATWDGVAVNNASDLATVALDVDALAAELTMHTELMAAATAYPVDALLEFHSGQMITLAGGWGNALSELHVHGDDIARAVGRTWAFDDADTEPFWRYTLRSLPGFLNDRGRAATDRWEFDLGYESGPVRIRFDHGDVHIDEAGDDAADVTVAGPAADLTLALFWNRRPASDARVAEFASRSVAV